jgi:polyhydroxybutyrate depolymerase
VSAPKKRGAAAAGRVPILPPVLRRLSLTSALLVLGLLAAGPHLQPDILQDTARVVPGSGSPADAATPPLQQAAAMCPPAGFTRLDGGHIRMPGGARPGATRLLLAIMSGADGDADDNLKLGEAANHQGIAVLYPTERAGSIWQLNDAMGSTDVAGVTGLLERALATGCFDPRRVSVVGLSNGAGFATRMACKLPTQFAAVVAVAGGYRALDPCPAAARASFLAIHGTADAIVPYNGKLPDRAGNVPRYATGWAARDGCGTTPLALHPRHLVTRLVFPGCPDGLRVQVLRLSGTDHGWPGAPPPWPRNNPSGVDANIEIMRFIRHAARP